MAVVKADSNVCQGYANCTTEAHEVFALNEDGFVEVVKPNIDEVDREAVGFAVRNCPVGALSLIDE